MSFRKQRIGVDVSKDTFDVKFLCLPTNTDRYKIRGSRKFKNSRKGILAFHEWLMKKRIADLGLVVIMEATGIYHEELAYFLHEQQVPVSIVLPNKVKAFARSHNQFSKTDMIDALVIARMGLERSLRLWKPANKSIRQLRHLTRERQALMQDRLRHSNQLHALKHSHQSYLKSMRRHEVSINLIDRQIKAIAKEIKEIQSQDEQLNEAMQRLRTIPQIGPLTAATVLAETGCFNLFSSRAQVVKYAGMDIIERQSGTSVLGKTRLSKRGNSHLRGALHMPAVGMINRQGPFNDVYRRVFDRTRCKMKAVVAVQRKLLVIMYAIIANKEEYSVDIHRQRAKRVDEPQGSPTVTLSAVASRS